MIRKNIKKENSFSIDSKKFSVNNNTNYILQTKITGHKGLPYSAYFTVIMLDSKLKEIDRKIRWISNFTNNQQAYELSFLTNEKINFVVFGYRINTETPVKSNIDLTFQEPDSLELKIQKKGENISDDITKYNIPTYEPLTQDQESLLEKKIVWIIAPPRSGTTWLGSRLLDHNSNIIWNESWIGLHLGMLRGGLAPVRDFHRFSPEDSKLTNITSSKIKLPKFDFEFERIFDMQSANGEYFFSPHHKNNWIPYLRKMILNRTFSHAQSLEKNIVIKDPVSCNAADIISESLPTSKMIFLIRDGRDEVDSRIDMHSKNSWAGLLPLDDEQERMHAISYYSKLWAINVENIRKGFDSHPSNLKILIKYEDLLKDTFQELKKIYNFIGIEILDDDLKHIIDLHDFKNIPDTNKGSGKFNRSASIGGWRKNFNENEKELMNLIMKKPLTTMGYI